MARYVDEIKDGVENMKEKAKENNNEEALELLEDAEDFIDDEKGVKALTRVQKAKNLLT